MGRNEAFQPIFRRSPLLDVIEKYDDSGCLQYFVLFPAPDHYRTAPKRTSDGRVQASCANHDLCSPLYVLGGDRIYCLPVLYNGRRPG